jgi:hypothetical protein
MYIAFHLLWRHLAVLVVILKYAHHPFLFTLYSITMIVLIITMIMIDG